MKRFILFISLVIMCINVNAQDRVNRPKLKYLTQGAKLTNFRGWSYDNEVGEWIGYNNVLVYNKEALKGMSTFPIFWKSKIYNNIISLQFKTIKFNNINYYVLVWEAWDGYYEDPYIEFGWKEYRAKRFLIFTEEQMEKLHNVSNDITYITVIGFERAHYDTHISEVDIIYNNLNEYFSRTYKPHYDNLENGFTIYKSTDNKIRFLFGEKEYHHIEEEYFEIKYDYFKTLINIQFPK